MKDSKNSEFKAEATLYSEMSSTFRLRCVSVNNKGGIFHYLNDKRHEKFSLSNEEMRTSLWIVENHGKKNNTKC